jgi:subtilisin family serine protease
MAAPHVAGAAAYLADAFGLTTPAQIEQKVRQYATSTGYADMGGNLIKIVQLP